MPVKEKQKKKSPRKSPTAILKDNIKDLKFDLGEQNDKYLRLKAEFDNYRKRKDNEFIDLLKYDGENIIKEFLSIIDDLHRSKRLFPIVNQMEVSFLKELI